MCEGINYSKPTFALISGSSKGIGREIAVSLSNRLTSGSLITICARSSDGLKETALLIKQGIDVKQYSQDLTTATVNDYSQIFDECKGNYENAVVFHNVGSLGRLESVTNLTDRAEWQRFFALNLFSVSELNSMFFTKMRPMAKKLFVINISSLCGSKPFKSMGMYGTGKAARNLFFKVLAEEETDCTVLNYSPGPVDTDMVSEVIDNTTSEEMKTMFVDLKEKKNILKAEDTVKKMLDVLRDGGFKSGDLIDYYNIV